MYFQLNMGDIPLLLLMVHKSCTSRYGRYPIIHRVSYMSGVAGFLPSRVCQFKSFGLVSQTMALHGFFGRFCLPNQEKHHDIKSCLVDSCIYLMIPTPNTYVYIKRDIPTYQGLVYSHCAQAGFHGGALGKSFTRSVEEWICGVTCGRNFAPH